MTIFDRFVSFTFGKQIAQRVTLAVRALDDARDTMLTGGKRQTEGWRDRYRYDREQVLQDALDAWRANPLARRIVSLTSQYVVGGGIKVECEHKPTHEFLQKFWTNRLNRMAVRSFELCDELTRSGELFVVLTTDAAGMSYVRAIPAADVAEVITADNDAEQPIRFVEKPTVSETVGRSWNAYDESDDTPGPTGVFPPVVMHYAINRPIGAKRGESDLAPMLRWLSRYASWLEDRARLNRYRQAFVYIVKAAFASAAEKESRQAALNSDPPTPGSILVTDASEEWQVLSPKLESVQAGEDGLALKKMVAVGSGTPLHFLAEPESATRTTAEASGGPTYRHYQQRQIFFLWLIQDLCCAVRYRRAYYDKHLNKTAEIKATGTDISGKDNAALAVAASTIVSAFGNLYDRGLIDEQEMIRMAYSFAGEIVDVPELLTRIAPPRAVWAMPLPPDTAPPEAGAKGKPDKKPGAAGPPAPVLKPPKAKVNPDTGDLTNVQGN